MNKFLCFKIVLMCSVLLYFTISYITQKTSYSHYEYDDESFNEEDIVCKVPVLTLENDRLKKNFHPMPPLICNGDNLLEMDDNGQLLINKTALNGKEIDVCKYYPIKWKTDYESVFLDPIIKTKEPFAIKIPHEFYKVECRLKNIRGKRNKTNYKQDYQQYFAHVVPDKHALARVEKLRREKNIPKEQMSVLILGLDSMSHLGYQRKLPKTYSYLKDTLGAVILNSYNIVSQGTMGAWLAIFTGRTLQDFPSTLKSVIDKYKNSVSIYPFIWKKYSENGYVTMMNEDSQVGGTLQNYRNGFTEKPVDHYIRTFLLATNETGDYCCGNRKKHQHQLDYVNSFLTNVPKFAFNFHEELSHGDNNPVEYIDDDLNQLIKSLKNNKRLDNTVLIVMGDHGARYGKMRRSRQGRIEERLPFMSMLFPEWFKKKYHKNYRNLKKNVNKLTTPYDIHETLKDIMTLSRLQLHKPEKSRGISLLREIPADRSCISANINAHWCTCLNVIQVDKDNTHIEKLAKLMVDEINRLISTHLDICAELTLNTTKNARLIIPDAKLLKTLQGMDLDKQLNNLTNISGSNMHGFQIAITTSPNDASYEATVEHNSESEEFHILGEISRTDRFRNQAKYTVNICPDLAMYCYCKK